MKTAFISDIHGNYPALVKVIEDAAANNADRFVFAGDYIFDLPFSNEVVRYLMQTENTFIVKGNKEAYLSRLINENQNNWIYDQMGALHQVFNTLPPDVLDFLTCLEDELTIPLDSGGFIFVTHYLKGLSPQSKTNCSSSNYHRKMLKKPFEHKQFLTEFNGLLQCEDYKNAIDKIDASVIVFGHDHLQRHGYCGKKLIINPGSCGQPLDFDKRAAYTILEETANGLKVIERRVEYDIESVIGSAKTSTVYEKGRIWCELVFLALRTGRDYFGFMFEIAGGIAKSKNESGSFFSNETWSEAYSILTRTYCVN